MKNQKKIYEIYYYSGGWRSYNNYVPKSPEFIVGHEKEIKTVLKDWESSIINRNKLKLIDEEYSCFNYLLHGPPGTGKSTFAKILASQLKQPIFIVDSTPFKNPQCTSNYELLNPNVKQGVILFEDFDRFLEEKKMDMSDLLNALDGVNNKHNYIRLFTVNNLSVIENNKALNNRIYSRFHFNYPTIDDFREKLNKMLVLRENYSKNLIELFIKQVSYIKNLSLRPFTTYVKRYLFENDFENLLLNNIEELRNLEIK
jgi:adenylate kinase family enzyme